MLLWLHEKLSKTDALSTLEFYFKTYRSIVEFKEHQEKGFDLLHEKSIKEYV